MNGPAQKPEEEGEEQFYKRLSEEHKEHIGEMVAQTKAFKKDAK